MIDPMAEGSDEARWLAERFEAKRAHLQGVAFRMLGSLQEADDAVQEAWLRLSRSDAASIENLGGWLTTVVGRVCLDMLRARKARREQPFDEQVGRYSPSHRPAGNGSLSNTGSNTVSGPINPLDKNEWGMDPEAEAILADSVGLALLVVLETLAPAERLAFVLHDLFAVPFDEIAPLVGRTPTAARQLASRARRRVQGGRVQSGSTPADKRATPRLSEAEISQQRKMVDAFLIAARAGDFDALLAMLDPEVMLLTDPYMVPSGVAREVRGAEAVARRSARGGARATQPALVNGSVGVVVAPRGRLVMVLQFVFVGDKIAEIEGVADPVRLRQFDLAILSD